MALVSMKTNENDNIVSSTSDNPYGYGLTINLNDDQCAALGVTEPIKAGTKMQIVAAAFVTRASESVDTDGDGDPGGNEVTLCLQITDMELTQGEASKPATSILYGS